MYRFVKATDTLTFLIPSIFQHGIEIFTFGRGLLYLFAGQGIKEILIAEIADAVTLGHGKRILQLTLEHVMLGLRTSAGLPADYLRAHCSPSALSSALSCGHLVSDGTCIRIPESHFFISDAIISSLV